MPDLKNVLLTVKWYEYHVFRLFLSVHINFRALWEAFLNLEKKSHFSVTGLRNHETAISFEKIPFETIVPHLFYCHHMQKHEKWHCGGSLTSKYVEKSHFR